MFFLICFLFIFCLALAFLEVQIEGPNGWAKNLPTWKPLDKKWYARMYKRMMSGKDLTGYHIGMFGLVLIVLHGFYFWRITWTWEAELQVIGMFFLVAVLWDYLWFVLNPHYGWKKFKPVHIAWHKSWLGPWPLDYYFGLLLFIVFYALSYVSDWREGAVDALLFLFGVATLSFIATLARVSIDRKKDRHEKK